MHERKFPEDIRMRNGVRFKSDRALNTEQCCAMCGRARTSKSKMAELFSVILIMLAMAAQANGQSSCNRACYPQFVDLINSDSASRTVSTNSTCGDPPEQYELRISSDAGDTFSIETCNSLDPTLSHPVNYVYDFTTFTIFNQAYTSPDLMTWWQSDIGAVDVHLTLDLGDVFLFQQTVISFRSYRPSSLIVQKSGDGGLSWTPLRYYAIDCASLFPDVPVTDAFNFVPDCREEYVFGHSPTQVDGEDIQQLIYNPVQELGQMFFEEDYQNYFSLTGVRILLLQPGRQEPLRSYFAVADWNVQGQCLCYGHAAECTGSNEAECVCQHNTMGDHCDSCLPLFNNRPWQAAVGSSTNACEDCGCGGRAGTCVYDEVKGYGICQECQENTSGDKCEVCMEDHYRNPYMYPTYNDTCIACNCTLGGTILGTICNETSGQCECKANVQGRACDECQDTFWNLQEPNDQGCQECDCDPIGTLGNINLCDKETGMCICKDNVGGERCDQCKAGTFNLDPSNPLGCTSCDCDPGAAISGSCDARTGACTCRPNIMGRACNTTVSGFYVPRLDGILLEAEMANTDEPVLIEERALVENAKHTGPGFLVVSGSAMVTFDAVYIPGTQNYILVIRYETAATWINATVEVSGPDTTPFECQGSLTSGNSSTSVGLLPAEYGGAYELPPLCLRGDAEHNVSITLAAADDTSPEVFLLDSIVLLPVLSDLEVYTSNLTSDDSRASMDTCWDASVSVNPQGRVNCSEIEFAVMAEVFNGAIDCDCSPQGADPNPVCAPYGGDCPCLPGVVGRSCDFCAPFFFGIETGRGCSACECNENGSLSQWCEQVTGVCDCRGNVIGDKCNSCAEDHYGLSTGEGCVPCNCSADYSLGTGCTDDGQCTCQPGVGGLNCTQCLPGFFNLTTDGCSGCDCNLVGSVDGDCDSQGQCICLSAATGVHCDQCPQGTYGFGTYSERGCLDCLCSSHTSNCTTANNWYEYKMVSRYSLLNQGVVAERWTGIAGDGTVVDVFDFPILSVSDPRLLLELVDPGNNDTNLFFVAPPTYHGDRRTAYGQIFEFVLSQSATANLTSSPEGDVFIYGMHINDPLVASVPTIPSPIAYKYQIKLHENYWRLGNATGAKPSSEEVVKILANISDIRIRAKYTKLPGQSVSFHEAALSLAVDYITETSDGTVDYVEECACPPEYTGQFCEQCASGYRRAMPGGGSFSPCVPCDCNGHSDLPCDLETGVCRECLHNTVGDFCEQCLDGYYGNATGGTPDDCQPCLCPGEPGSNSFAATCDQNGVCIECAEGHGGENCEFCIEGYYGVPTDIENNGGRCEPCFCNLSPATCDSETGQCLNCSGETEGHTCEVCRFGFWGSIDNCQECTCNLTGGYGNCTQDAGVCYCYPNVVGDGCTECAPDSWGFDSGSGCMECDCHPVGTLDRQTQCDLLTGQCLCKDRVTGQKCDQCMMGYYDIDQECIACGCNVNGTAPTTCADGLCGCDLVSGQCSCKLATIAGRTCDQCGRIDEEETQVVAEIFVGNFPNCAPCPECFQNWREELEVLGEMLVEERQRLLSLLGNYGNLTEAEVESVLGAIRGNLSLANKVIDDGSMETQNLQNIQAAFILISATIQNQTELLNSISALEDEILVHLSASADFDGTVEVEPGITRTSEQLDQELDAVMGTLENIFTQGRALWDAVQRLYQDVLDSQIQAQQLITEADGLARDVEATAAQRSAVEDIVSDSDREAEMEVNAQRLQIIDSVQAGYPLEVAAQNMTAAERLAQEANQTAREAYGQALEGKTMSDGIAYRSQLARHNATSAATAAGNAYTQATTYKDIALSTKANMTQNYIDILAAYAELKEATTDSAEAEQASVATQDLTVRDPGQMQALVQQIDATSLSDAAVFPLLENATQSLESAEASLNKTRQSLQEALMVKTQIDTVEFELSEAERLREATASTVNITQSNVTTINQLASQIEEQGQSKLNEALETSTLVNDLLEEAVGGQECFSAKRSQVQDAVRRANRARDDVTITEGELASVTQEVDDLGNQIATQRTASTQNLESTTVVDEETQQLASEVASVVQMANINDLMERYIAQRSEMEQLSQDLVEMEASLDAVLANLEGATTGQIQCND